MIACVRYNIAPEGLILACEDYAFVGDDEQEGLIQKHNDEDKDRWMDMKWFYMGMSLGFVVVFVADIGPLPSKRA